MAGKNIACAKATRSCLNCSVGLQSTCTFLLHARCDATLRQESAWPSTATFVRSKAHCIPKHCPPAFHVSSRVARTLLKSMMGSHHPLRLSQRYPLPAPCSACEQLSCRTSLTGQKRTAMIDSRLSIHAAYTSHKFDSCCNAPDTIMLRAFAGWRGLAWAIVHCSPWAANSRHLLTVSTVHWS